MESRTPTILRLQLSALPLCYMSIKKLTLGIEPRLSGPQPEALTVMLCKQLWGRAELNCRFLIQSQMSLSTRPLPYKNVNEGI